MASAQKSNKASGSRWNFLSQAVASVESRLDTILGDEDEAPRRVPTPSQANRDNASPSRGSTESARANAQNDRLQERLAKAMVKKNVARTESPASLPESSPQTPAIAASSPKTSLQRTDSSRNSVEKADEQDSGTTEDQKPVPTEASTPASADNIASLGIPIADAAEFLPVDTTLKSNDISDLSDRPTVLVSDDQADEKLLQAQLEHEHVKSKMEEEIKGYIERIDAMNAKLQYLAKESAKSSKQAASEAGSGSLERKLHEKDEKIALLMEEGQVLSVTEMKHLTMIKRLKASAATNNRDQDAIRKRAEKAEQNAAALDEQAKRAEIAAKKAEERLATLSKTSQDLEAVAKERNALNETLIEVRAQLTKANARAESAESRATTDRLEAEKRRAAELEDDLSSAKVERELAEEKLRKEIKDLQASLEQEKEQGRAMETEMLAEQATLESRLESFRIRAEEASSNDHGDAQAKLLRQIETLQSQYTAASQNWQGIEGTLLTRITALERERDEVTTRESDVRRKLRDVSLKGKSSERDLDEVQQRLMALEESQSDTEAERRQLTRRNQELEEELNRAQTEIESQKSRLEREYAKKLDEERSKWAASIQLHSPAAPSRKGAAIEMGGMLSPTNERPPSRKSSSIYTGLNHIEASAPSPRHPSSISMRGLSINGAIPETPSIVTSADNDEYFAGVLATPGSPDHLHSRRGFGDLISTSTVGAGPSVQLVERMSANVRRLESEKAASKDELARITAQRDESRQEVVRLMRESDQKKNIDEKLKHLEEEHKTLAERHATTLELLGEKSEQVEELKADIADVKQMYRDLADHMK